MRLSIVVPAYNVEKYIGPALDSILRQTRPPAEVVVIDDGSTDRTPEILDAYRANPLFRLYRTENRGLGEARNLGLEHATGDYVYFFDSDDLLSERFVEEITQRITEYGQPDLVFFSGAAFFDQGYVSDFSPNYHRGVDRFVGSGPEAVQTLCRHGTFFASACLYVARRAFWLERALAFKAIVHEDEELIFRMAAQAHRAVILDAVFFHRRVRAGSIMAGPPSQSSLAGYESALRAMLAFRAAHPERYAALRKEWQARCYNLLRAIAVARKQGGFKVDLSLYWKLFRSPFLFFFLSKLWARARRNGNR